MRVRVGASRVWRAWKILKTGGLAAVVIATVGCVGLPGSHSPGPGASAGPSAGAPGHTGASPADRDPFATAPVLERERVVAEILARNPTLQSARHAWRAALERPAQVRALEDPIVGYGAAPRSFGEDDLDDAHVFDVSQALPFPGKLALRGAVAEAEAEAARGDFEASRLRLAVMGSLLFDEHYFATRARAINARHVELLGRFRRIALARYEAGEATSQDPLQAEAELARGLQRDLALETRLRVTRQQLNSLLRRSPAALLPPVPSELVAPRLVLSELAAEPLLAAALEARPELQAAQARVEARQAQVQAARLDFLPDFTVVGNYNRRLPISENRPFLGLRLNVPLQLGRRRAALKEAQLRLSAAESESAAASDRIELAVHQALEEYDQALAIHALFDARLLPAARDRVAAAQAGFETGRNSFLELIDAERELLRVELDRESASTEVSQHTARLLAAAGRIPGLEGGRP